MYCAGRLLSDRRPAVVGGVGRAGAPVMRFWLGVYTLLLHAATPFVLMRLWWKGRELPAYRERVGERFGRVPAPGETIEVWVHAVSVGETLAAQPLIEALIARHGPGRVWITTTTPTGSARVQAAYGTRVHHSYAPYDLPGAVGRFLDRVRPRRVVIMETELWPNLFFGCERRGIPVLIANGRLSPRSFRGYARLDHLIAPVLHRCSSIAAQSKADARRFLRLGAPRERVDVIGNLKYEVELPDAQLAAGRALRKQFGAQRPVWIAASTHEDEERAALAAHASILELFPDAVLIIVPRHPQRFDAVWRLMQDSGLRIERRTRMQALSTSGHTPSLERVQVLLGDSMGEMFLYLAAADAAFVGGSLAPVGGHNVLEPAALAMPVVFGPHMANFAAARALLLRKGAAVEVPNEAELAAEISVLLGEPATRKAMGQAGEAAVAGNRGALKRLLRLIDTLPVAAGAS